MNFMQADVDSRIKLFIDLEDPTIITDLRTLNSSSERTKYDRFWEECDAVLNEEVDTDVDDRRHSEVTHLASALSVRDFSRESAGEYQKEHLRPVRNGYAYSSGQRQGMPNLHCTIQAA